MPERAGLKGEAGSSVAASGVMRWGWCSIYQRRAEEILHCKISVPLNFWAREEEEAISREGAKKKEGREEKSVIPAKAGISLFAQTEPEPQRKGHSSFRWNDGWGLAVWAVFWLALYCHPAGRDMRCAAAGLAAAPLSASFAPFRQKRRASSEEKWRRVPGSWIAGAGAGGSDGCSIDQRRAYEILHWKGIDPKWTR